MDIVFQNFHQAQSSYSGPLLASTLTPIPPPHAPTILRKFHKDSNVFSIQSDIQRYIKTPPSYLPKPEANAWIDIYVAYWKAIGEILRAETGHHRDDWAVKVYEAWKEVVNLLIRGYSNAGFGAWTMPCLYVAGKYLRVFAIKADEEKSRKSEVEGGPVKMETDGLGDDVMGVGEKNEKLEDAARVINRVFTLCISDRAPLEESRKWGLYNTTNLLFKTYFKLNSISLSKNILRALQASRTDMPPMEAFPKSHIVTFKYYVGVIHFLDEEYSKAEENLTSAFHMCHKDAQTNKEYVNPIALSPKLSQKTRCALVSSGPRMKRTEGADTANRLLLTYLIPTHLHTSLSLPSRRFLLKYPSLNDLFCHVTFAIRSGSLLDFTSALEDNESIYVKRRIFLSLERARDLCLRNLLRRIWLLEGGKEKTRILIQSFAAGVRWSLVNTAVIPPAYYVEKGECSPVRFQEPEEGAMENDEVECLIAGLIYKVCPFLSFPFIP
ncbi:MAG: hypothetical protein Q9181_000719 [Wetmoreana brouardii]